MDNLNYRVNQLLDYGMMNHFFSFDDYHYVANRLIAFLKVNEFISTSTEKEKIEQVVDALYYQYLKTNPIIKKEIFICSLIDVMMPYPSQIQQEFDQLLKVSSLKAVDYFYKLSLNSLYINLDALNKNIIWNYQHDYGNFIISINVSKPEKDIKSIINESINQSVSYPLCKLCVENVGYEGRSDYPSRANHRTVKLLLQNEIYHLQYSPYAYYEEHCILLSSVHRKMKISDATFKLMVEFVERFPFYFLGSNADLPIVGGSILSHDHFQGGKGNMPIEEAKVTYEAKLNDKISLAILNWPLAVIRIKSQNKEELVNLASNIFALWSNYFDESVNLYAYTDAQHNTITPITRYKNNYFEMDLILRNNKTSTQHPEGIFHAHQDVFHIKKENLGLIEVMGLAILPQRLVDELALCEKVLNKEIKIIDDERLAKHQVMIENIIKKNNKDIKQALVNEVSETFIKGLKDAGVFKDDKEGRVAFMKFIELIKQNYQ